MHPSNRTPIRSLLLVLVAALALTAGCSTSSGDGDKADTKSAAGTGSGSDAKATTTRPSSSDDESPTTAPPSDDDDVVGTAKGQLEASPNDDAILPLRMDVTRVERLSGDTVEVRFTITNESETTDFEPFRTLSDNSIAGGGYNASGLALLDRPNDKKYLVLFDTEGLCLCSGDLEAVKIEPGGSADLYADVTAPPTSTKQVDLSLPGFTPIAGLEIG